MNSNERRNDIIKMLINLNEPVKGSNLAKKYKRISKGEDNGI